MNNVFLQLIVLKITILQSWLFSLSMKHYTNSLMCILFLRNIQINHFKHPWSMLEFHNKQKQHKTKKHSIPFLKSIPLAIITVLNCTFNYLTWLILDQQESVHYLCVYKPFDRGHKESKQLFMFKSTQLWVRNYNATQLSYTNFETMNEYLNERKKREWLEHISMFSELLTSRSYAMVCAQSKVYAEHVQEITWFHHPCSWSITLPI